MARVCEVTGKRPVSGYNVSHSNNHTKRRFLPNLHKKRYYLASEDRFVTLKLSTHAMRIIHKRGVEAVVADMRREGKTV